VDWYKLFSGQSVHKRNQPGIPDIKSFQVPNKNVLFSVNGQELPYYPCIEDQAAWSVVHGPDRGVTRWSLLFVFNHNDEAAYGSLTS